MRSPNFKKPGNFLSAALLAVALLGAFSFGVATLDGPGVQPHTLTASIIGCWLGNCSVNVNEYDPECTISVEPSSASPGTPVTIVWSSDILSPYLTPDFGTVGVSGFREASPNQSTTYTLYDHAGAYGWLRYWLYAILGIPAPKPYCSAVLTVSSSPAAPTCILSAFPSTIVSGDSTSLYYNVAGDFSSANIQGVGPAVMPPTTYTVSPTQDELYQLSVSGLGGNNKCYAPVNVEPAPTVPTLYLEVSPSRVAKGKPVIVAWSGKNVTSCTLRSSQGQTLATGLQNPIPAPAFTVDEPTTFTLICSPSSGAPISKSVSVLLLPWIEEI